jgi:8-oxo-dGTP diphosphatase
VTKRVDVAAAVITRPDGAFLLGQRAPGTFYPGYWEFPGGKVEPGETPRQALIRELREELGIEAREAWPWLTREFAYEHAHVRLHFFEVPAWSGTANDHVHAALAWQRPEESGVAPMLPANGPVLKALRLPRTMGITHAGQIGISAQIAVLENALARGLRLVQVREPDLPPQEKESCARAVLALARPAGALVMVNGDVELARRIGADGLHLRAAQLAATESRPGFEWVGASCHTRPELERAAELGLDYALLGPLRPTATHPDRPGLGWEAFAAMIAGLPLPVLALGGLTTADLRTARTAGAHGIAAIRGAWDPA